MTALDPKKLAETDTSEGLLDHTARVAPDTCPGCDGLLPPRDLLCNDCWSALPYCTKRPLPELIEYLRSATSQRDGGTWPAALPAAKDGAR